MDDPISGLLEKALAAETFGRDAKDTDTAKIRKHKAQILLLRSKGATWPAIVDVLAAGGLVVTRELVRSAVMPQSRKKSKSRSLKASKVNSPAPRSTEPSAPVLATAPVAAQAAEVVVTIAPVAVSTAPTTTVESKAVVRRRTPPVPKNGTPV
jgi:hypothetical protein